MPYDFRGNRNQENFFNNLINLEIKKTSKNPILESIIHINSNAHISVNFQAFIRATQLILLNQPDRNKEIILQTELKNLIDILKKIYANKFKENPDSPENQVFF